MSTPRPSRAGASSFEVAVGNLGGSWRGSREKQNAEPIVVEGRVPPHDLDAEAAVLSSIMVDPLALDKVLEFLKAEHFYSEAHRRIYEACIDLRSRGQPVDVVQVGTWLKS